MQKYFWILLAVEVFNVDTGGGGGARSNRAPLHEPFLFIVFLVLFSFVLYCFYRSCFLKTK